jgi:hypothetical protein
MYQLMRSGNEKRNQYGSVKVSTVLTILPWRGSANEKERTSFFRPVPLWMGFFEGNLALVFLTIVQTDLWSQRTIVEKAIVVRMGFNQSRVKF